MDSPKKKSHETSEHFHHRRFFNENVPKSTKFGNDVLLM